MRSNLDIPDLTFPKATFGLHEIHWNLDILLYVGGADLAIRTTRRKIHSGTLGAPSLERLPLVFKIHEVKIAALPREVAGILLIDQLATFAVSLLFAIVLAESLHQNWLLRTTQRGLPGCITERRFPMDLPVEMVSKVSAQVRPIAMRHQLA